MNDQKLLPMCAKSEPGSWSWAASLCDMEPYGDCAFVLPALSSVGVPGCLRSPFDSPISGEPIFCFDLLSFYSRNL